MSKLEIASDKRPHYFRGQLLLETDFRREQEFHVEGMRRHNRELHGWGIVHGLEVVATGPRSVTVRAGAAIDEDGREITVSQATAVDLASYGPNERLELSLAVEEGADGGEQSFVPISTCLRIDRAVDRPTGLHVGIVQLDDRGHVTESGIDPSRRRYSNLARRESERRVWWTSPFRPHPAVSKEPGVWDEVPPPFRIGVTQALSPGADDMNERDKGAGGTMAIPIPFGATRITRFRVAGTMNEGEISVRLIVGGWDAEKNEHVRRVVLDRKIPQASPYLQTFTFEEGQVDPEYNTIALVLGGTRRTSVSLIGVEFALASSG